jgi:hypothetical protein
MAAAKPAFMKAASYIAPKRGSGWPKASGNAMPASQLYHGGMRQLWRRLNMPRMAAAEKHARWLSRHMPWRALGGVTKQTWLA